MRAPPAAPVVIAAVFQAAAGIPTSGREAACAARA
jgi:hypothetical protein